jgi:hypothetical protein
LSGGNRSGLLFDSSSGAKKLSKRQASFSGKIQTQQQLKKGDNSNELSKGYFQRALDRAAFFACNSPSVLIK